MKIVGISDLHCQLPDIPEADLLLIAGDVCLGNHKVQSQRDWLKDVFLKWLESQPVRQTIIVFGNHDFVAEEEPSWIPYFKNCIILKDEIFEFEGKKIYGLPWQLRMGNWAFNLDEEEISEKYKIIPLDVDIIVSHGPPYGYGDLTSNGEHVGSPSFTRRIKEVKPKLVICGHVHPGRGVFHLDETIVANVALVNSSYKMIHQPMQFEI